VKVILHFDIVLPSVFFLLIASSIFIQDKLKNKISSLFEEAKFSTKEAILTAVWIGIAVTVMALVPGEAIRIFFLTAYSYILFSFTRMLLKKWYIAIFPPILFICSYLFFWNLATFNISVAVFFIIIILYTSGLFSWRTVWIFAALLTIMDVIQVFLTGFMVQSATKMLELRLPVLLILPMYPYTSIINLGLGDIYLASLISIQASAKYRMEVGVLMAATNGIAMFLFEALMLNTRLFTFFPATLVVIAGSIMGLGIARIMKINKRTG